jgi:hypothetical protein
LRAATLPSPPTEPDPPLPAAARYPPPALLEGPAGAELTALLPGLGVLVPAGSAAVLRLLKNVSEATAIMRALMSDAFCTAL